MTSNRRDGPAMVLIVEDNPGDVRLVREGFADADMNPEFHTVSDGREALSFLRECSDEDRPACPDLVLLDLNLPRVDGFEVLEEMKNDHRYPAVPVVVLSSSKSEEDVTECYDRHANAYLAKPDGPDGFATMAKTIEGFWFDAAITPPTPA
ncbi:Response regulator receiver domain-containing protein [Halopelagius inordinatus]|uniref:Response regulator receiver domain-containing protein n=1 Tax=Halopelagius inordinatus TaxID=553467 RepID=A0A1I2SNJ8_9EURY|nr:response regulator [Halopelagius inordinatus]SFG54334.1 Response regulator receiver domain-containing protein [Halopelagius inordinatus]